MWYLCQNVVLLHLNRPSATTTARRCLSLRPYALQINAVILTQSELNLILETKFTHLVSLHLNPPCTLVSARKNMVIQPHWHPIRSGHLALANFTAERLSIFLLGRICGTQNVAMYLISPSTATTYCPGFLLGRRTHQVITTISTYSKPRSNFKLLLLLFDQRQTRLNSSPHPRCSSNHCTPQPHNCCTRPLNRFLLSYVFISHAKVLPQCQF